MSGSFANTFLALLYTVPVWVPGLGLLALGFWLEATMPWAEAQNMFQRSGALATAWLIPAVGWIASLSVIASADAMHEARQSRERQALREAFKATGVSEKTVEDALKSVGDARTARYKRRLATNLNKLVFGFNVVLLSGATVVWGMGDLIANRVLHCGAWTC